MIIPTLASKIDLSNRGLTEIPAEIFKCKNLKKLNLSNNKIKVIPQELTKLKYLTNLDLSNNEISVLYAKNCEFCFLEVLMLKNNKLKNVPKQISRLVRLRKLSLSGNMISTLPDELGNMSSLISLNISANRFTSFPNAVLNLKQLKQLWLSKNAFKNFPIDDIKNDLVGLKSLYTFGPIGNDGSDINQEYAFLQRHKGNSITQVDLLALKAKGKKRNLVTNYIQDEVEMKKKSIFISYCHEDDTWLTKLNLVLKTMEYEGLNFDSWSDKRINTGDVWKTEIETALANADIAILLVSNHFLASKFIREQEVPPLLQKAKDNGTVILPVIVGICRFTKSPIGVYQSVNAPDKPLNAMTAHEVEKVLYDLTLEIDRRLSIA